MKLINKLMPLASCLALGATVAPISLTSCANSEFVDLKDDYLPTITKADGSSYDYELTKEDALSVYVNAINENPQRFIDDCNWTFASALNGIANNPYIKYLADGDGEHLIVDGYDETTIEYKTIGYSSTLDYAKQKVSNVVMGKTTFLYPDVTEQKWVETTVPTISFDLEREQKFTYTTNDYYVINKTEGITKTKFNVKNVPILLTVLDVPSDPWYYTEMVGNEDEAHLGRFLMNPEFFARIAVLIPSYWTLQFDVDPLTGSLQWMVDPWSISYETSFDDKETISYNDVTSVESWSESYSGSFDTWEKLMNLYYTDYSILSQLAGWSVKSYYLSDISVKEGE